MSGIRWASALHVGADPLEGLERCAAQVAGELGPEAPPSLVAVFAAAEDAGALEPVPELLRARFPDAVVLGCSAGGVIGAGREVEDEPAVSVTAGHLPGARATPFRVTAGALPSPDDPPEAWMRLTAVTARERPAFLLLADPFFPHTPDLLAGLDYAFPGAPKAGGIASGGRRPGAGALFLGEDTWHDGAVGVALTGDVVVETVVAQGCRPIGDPRRVTACHKNLLLEVDGEPPLRYLEALYPTLDPRDRRLMAGNLFLGIATYPSLADGEARPGDFLIRNLIGADRGRGILAVGELLREGQVVQFHVRDAATSAEDLERQLRRYLEQNGSAAGGLLFQCNGRGAHLYGKPGHDATLFQAIAGPVPLGGFFCNGEIGPVGPATYLHGYTSAFALFRQGHNPRVRRGMEPAGA